MWAAAPEMYTSWVRNAICRPCAVPRRRAIANRDDARACMMLTCQVDTQLRRACARMPSARRRQAAV